MTHGDAFAREHIQRIFTEKKRIIDIGGDLGLDAARANRVKRENAWLIPYLSSVEYVILDKEDTYHPDLVGDIHNLPLPDNSVDAYICTSVLQHVENPRRAVEELYRTLKPGGYCFLYVPFIFYYHPLEGYYKDYWRFTDEGLRILAREFSSIELAPSKGPFATLLNLIPPLSKKRIGFVDWFDRLVKPNSKQVSGWYAFCVK